MKLSCTNDIQMFWTLQTHFPEFKLDSLCHIVPSFLKTAHIKQCYHLNTFFKKSTFCVVQSGSWARTSGKKSWRKLVAENVGGKVRRHEHLRLAGVCAGIAMAGNFFLPRKRTKKILILQIISVFSVFFLYFPFFSSNSPYL